MGLLPLPGGMATERRIHAAPKMGGTKCAAFCCFIPACHDRQPGPGADRQRQTPPQAGQGETNELLPELGKKEGSKGGGYDERRTRDQCVRRRAGRKGRMGRHRADAAWTKEAFPRGHVSRSAAPSCHSGCHNVPKAMVPMRPPAPSIAPATSCQVRHQRESRQRRVAATTLSAGPDQVACPLVNFNACSFPKRRVRLMAFSAEA